MAPSREGGEMMRVAMIGLGKLGLPCSIAMAQCGHEVYGYDIDEDKRAQYRQGYTDIYEPDIGQKLEEALQDGLYLCDSVGEVMLSCPEIVFIAVPTPSLPDHSFNVEYVKNAVKEIVEMGTLLRWYPIITIISTVLPSTMRNELAPLVPSLFGLCYNPYFIAMGTVIRDYMKPEFILIGEDCEQDGETLERFYDGLAPVIRMNWENAELTKMCYNTFIGMKIVVANAIMEMSHKIPHANCSVVSDALMRATDRVASGKYLRGGMGDGGECHPRDNLALGFLCDELDMDTNPFRFIMDGRMMQAGWLAELMSEHWLPHVIVGKRFKPNTNLTTDSASILVGEYLENNVTFYDPMLGLTDLPEGPCAFLVAIEEDWVRDMEYPEGSVVLDVWRQFTADDVRHLEENDVIYVAVGVGK